MPQDQNLRSATKHMIKATLSKMAVILIHIVRATSPYTRKKNEENIVFEEDHGIRNRSPGQQYTCRKSQHKPKAKDTGPSTCRGYPVRSILEWIRQPENCSTQPCQSWKAGKSTFVSVIEDKDTNIIEWASPEKETPFYIVNNIRNPTHFVCVQLLKYQT